MMERRDVTALAAATAVGVAAAPLWRLGVGWPLAALAVAGAAVTARSGRSTVDGGRRVDRAWRGAAGVAALLLAAVPAIRAAGWLAALCLLVAVLLGSYALAGGRSWGGILAGALAFLPAAVRGLGWSAGAAATQGSRRSGRVVVGVLTGAVLLAVFGSLFNAADPAFGDLLRGWVNGIDYAEVARAGLGGLFAVTAALAAMHLARNPSAGPDALGVNPRLGPLEWAIPLAMLDVLFGIFVWLQLRVLFGGDRYVLGPGGPDYAVHARGGFGQLATVTVLTLGVVATLVLVARRENAVERGLVRLLGGLLCALTLVIVASALKRLALYAGAYGFTVPRLLAFAGEVWLGLVFGLLLAAGVRLRAAWMPRAALAAGVLVLFTLVAVNPEALMARTLLARYGGPYPVDVRYLEGLSTDAAAEIATVPRIARCVLLDRQVQAQADDEPWYAFNLSRHRARAWLADYPVIEPSSPLYPYCPR